MMAAFSYHGVGYMVYWVLLGWEVFAEEMTDWFDCGKCSHINSADGIGPARTCYVDCTRTCLPGCAGGAAVGADGAFDIAALADPATGGKAAAALVAQSAAPALSHELLTTSLPRAAKAA